VIDAVVGAVIWGTISLCFAMSATLMLVGGAVVLAQQTQRLLRWLTCQLADRSVGEPHQLGLLP
jgi:hypothetical protein